jgi:hypothetical protein
MGTGCGERLIYQDKVKHIICQFNSPPIIGVLGVAEPNKVLQICNGMTERTMEPNTIILPSSLHVLQHEDRSASTISRASACAYRCDHCP